MSSLHRPGSFVNNTARMVIQTGFLSACNPMGEIDTQFNLLILEGFQKPQHNNGQMHGRQRKMKNYQIEKKVCGQVGVNIPGM